VWNPRANAKSKEGCTASVTVDGGPSPDGRAVRYFGVVRKFGGEGSWEVTSETDAYRYFQALLP